MISRVDYPHIAHHPRENVLTSGNVFRRDTEKHYDDAKTLDIKLSLSCNIDVRLFDAGNGKLCMVFQHDMV